MNPPGQSVREAGELLSFVDRADGNGFSIVDHVERRRCEVSTSEPVAPEERPASAFGLPVDRVVSMTAARLSIPHTVAAYVRDPNGRPIGEITKGDERTFRERCYRIEFTAPIKLYVVVEAGFEITVTEDDLTIEFAERTAVTLGARTHHDRPAATVTTTEKPEDLMRAVSSFGSGLKTTSCERSYPTLRGHPPSIAYGDDCSVPDVLEAPNTGVRIEVPPEYGAVYAVSSLAYYLGATVAPGSDATIMTDTGFIHRLDGTDRGFEREVERVLKQCFFLDCVTRTEGHYPVDLHERNQIEDDVALDFPRLYGEPLADQLEAYLEVPYSVVEPHVPRWKLAAHVEPDPGSAAALPFVARDLATIRSREPTQSTERVPGTTESLGIDEFVRSRGSGRSKRRDRIDCGRSPLVRIDGTDALEDMWIGEGVPIGATKGMVEAFRNHATRTPSDGDIDITVVVNDSGMGDESRDVNRVYGSRDVLPFDVTVAEQLTTGELKDVLRAETDFLHYIGHIDEGGFECSNGMVDAGALGETGVDAFFLNACDSYRQGKRLVEAGAIAGVATLTPVPNDEAEEMGKKLARLLNLGFPLYAALDVASIGQEYNRYTSIGDSSFNIVQPEGGAATICEAKEKSENDFEVSYYTYLTGKSLIGAMTNVYINSNKYFLTSGKIREFELSKSGFEHFISMGELPVIKSSNIYWRHEDLYD
jgi:hypothetical protein